MRARRTWSFDGLWGSFIVIRAGDLREGERPLDPVFVEALLDYCFADAAGESAAGRGRQVRGGARVPRTIPSRAIDPFALRAVVELYEAVGGIGCPGSLGRQATRENLSRHVKPRLIEAFRRGELLGVRPWSRGSGAGGDEDRKQQEEKQEEKIREPEKASKAAPPPASTSGSKQRKTWVEIELVDGDGKPVPGEKYRLELPDGSVREGSLDSTGRVRLDEIDPGTCLVSFPDLDAKEWGAA